MKKINTLTLTLGISMCSTTFYASADVERGKYNFEYALGSATRFKDTFEISKISKNITIHGDNGKRGFQSQPQKGKRSLTCLADRIDSTFTETRCFDGPPSTVPATGILIGAYFDGGRINTVTSQMGEEPKDSKASNDKTVKRGEAIKLKDLLSNGGNWKSCREVDNLEPAAWASCLDALQYEGTEWTIRYSISNRNFNSNLKIDSADALEGNTPQIIRVKGSNFGDTIYGVANSSRICLTKPSGNFIDSWCFSNGDLTIPKNNKQKSNTKTVLHVTAVSISNNYLNKLIRVIYIAYCIILRDPFQGIFYGFI